MTFYDNLIKILAKKGITIAEFGRMMNMNTGNIYSWRRRGNKPNDVVIHQMADVLGVSYEALAYGEEVPTIPNKAEYEISPFQQILIEVTKDATSEQIARLIDFWYKEVK